MVTIIISVNANSVLASDNDDDGIDDKIEELNFRDIEISFDTNETEVESMLRSGKKIDEIAINVLYDEEGVSIEVSYESDFISEGGEDFEVEFGVSFRKIIEYVDLNSNDIYDPLIDNLIQEHDLDAFQVPTYVKEQLTTLTSLHQLIINSSDGIFTLHIYIPEEFYLLNNTLITPSKPKIDIEINNFDFLNSSSRLALDIRLESEISYEEDDLTEDEQKGYASNERAVSTTSNDFTGIFSWNENATVDGILSQVIASSLESDDNGSDDQRIYLNYKQGAIIQHDPKIGIESILRSKLLTNPPLNIIFILLIIVVGSVSVSVPVYYYIHEHKRSAYPKRTHRPEIKEKKISRTDLSELEHAEVTALSEKFYNVVNQFEWDINEKEQFLNEMFSLSPKERDKIINEMIEKSNKN
ncbi:MAG: hypothetical protein ACFFA3_19980 [Promethearchaeota archaeon]